MNVATFVLQQGIYWHLLVKQKYTAIVSLGFTEGSTANRAPIPVQEGGAPNLGFDDAAIEALLSASRAAVATATTTTTTTPCCCCCYSSSSSSSYSFPLQLLLLLLPLLLLFLLPAPTPTPTATATPILPVSYS